MLSAFRHKVWPSIIFRVQVRDSPPHSIPIIVFCIIIVSNLCANWINKYILPLKTENSAAAWCLRHCGNQKLYMFLCPPLPKLTWGKVQYLHYTPEGWQRYMGNFVHTSHWNLGGRWKAATQAWHQLAPTVHPLRLAHHLCSVKKESIGLQTEDKAIACILDIRHNAQ